MEFEPGAGVIECGRIDPAHPFPSPCFARHEAGAFEHPKMLGHRSEREVERPGEMADRRLSLGQTIEDGAAGGIAKCMEDSIQIMFNHTVEYTASIADVQPIGRKLRDRNWWDASRFLGMAGNSSSLRRCEARRAHFSGYRLSAGAASRMRPSRPNSSGVRNRSCCGCTLYRRTKRQGFFPGGRNSHASAKLNI